MLTALRGAATTRLGGDKGALVLGGLACAAAAHSLPVPAGFLGTVIVCAAGALAGAVWVALAGVLRQYRGINETISSLLLAYIALGFFKLMVEGPLRDPTSLNKPSTYSLSDDLRIGGIAGSDALGLPARWPASLGGLDALDDASLRWSWQHARRAGGFAGDR
ncbi:ABC transporter permease subunit [Roseateles sp. GG27B]